MTCHCNEFEIAIVLPASNERHPETIDGVLSVLETPTPYARFMHPTAKLRATLANTVPSERDL